MAEKNYANLKGPLHEAHVAYPTETAEEEKNDEIVDKILDRQDVLEKQRTNHQSLWQTLYDNIVPRKGDVITTRQEGDKRGHDLFDSTAINSNTLLAGALHGMLTNPETRFFDLVMNDPALDDQVEVKAWLQEVSQRMFLVLQNSNFQTEVHEIYIDQGAIGNACLYMAEHDESIIHFNARAMKEIFIQENNLGLVDIVHRKFKWTPRQMVQEFGLKNLPENIQDLYNKGSADPMEIIHAVEPKSDEKKNYFEFMSAYVLRDEETIISKRGYKEFPYAVPRWTKTSGETYGRGPGHDALPDVLMLNAMMETTLKGAQKTVDPPLMVTDDSVIGRVRLIPGGLTMVRPMTSNDPIKPLITDARIDFGFQAIEAIRKSVRSAFFVDQLQLNQGPQMTATEVMQRTEEKLRLMGPVLGRQQFEFLRPVIDRLFGIMVRKNLIPPAPQVLQGKKFDVKYSSLIAKVQRTNQGQDLSRAIATAAPILQLFPDAKDNMDGDKAFKHVMSIYDVPQKILASESDVKKIRAGRTQAQQQIAQQAQEQHTAQVAGQVLPGVSQLAQANKPQGQ